MLERVKFLEQYNITTEEFENSGLDWLELMGIYSHYLAERIRLEPVSEYIAETLRKAQKVHTVKHRIKDPEHLIEKIIRKKIKNPQLEFTVESYSSVITDLIGIRALHLFKEDWTIIHQFISEKWELAEKPKANIRVGDDEKQVEKYKENDFEIVNHPFGYRSLHYLIKSKPDKQEVVAEIQVRTIFEEGWSEIDHLIRYPYDINNPILGYYLVLFNRLAGNADEMGSYVSFLKDELDRINSMHQQELQEKNDAIAELETRINELKIESSEKEELKKKIEKLKKQVSSVITSNPISGGIMQNFGEGFNITKGTGLNLVPSLKDSLIATSIFDRVVNSNDGIRALVTHQDNKD